MPWLTAGRRELGERGSDEMMNRKNFRGLHFNYYGHTFGKFNGPMIAHLLQSGQQMVCVREECPAVSVSPVRERACSEGRRRREGCHPRQRAGSRRDGLPLPLDLTAVCTVPVSLFAGRGREEKRGIQVVLYLCDTFQHVHNLCC